MITTWSVVIPPEHGPLLTVQANTLAPRPNPVMPEAGSFGEVIVPLPLTNVQVPVDGKVGTLPCRVAVNGGAHNCWSGPALATGLFGSKTTMFTSSCVLAGVHGPLLIVQRNVLTPTPRPVTWLFGAVGETRVPLPATRVHWPEAGAGAALPARVVLVWGAHNCWSAPAFAAG